MYILSLLVFSLFSHLSYMPAVCRNEQAEMYDKVVWIIHSAISYIFCKCQVCQTHASYIYHMQNLFHCDTILTTPLRSNQCWSSFPPIVINFAVSQKTLSFLQVHHFVACYIFNECWANKNRTGIIILQLIDAMPGNVQRRKKIFGEVHKNDK